MSPPPASRPARRIVRDFNLVFIGQSGSLEVKGCRTLDEVGEEVAAERLSWGDYSIIEGELLKEPVAPRGGCREDAVDD